MRRFLLFSSLLAISFCASAQQKKALNLQQAVMESRTIFAPTNIDQLAWIPDTEEYSYVKDKGPDVFLMRGFIDGREDEEITSMNRLANGFKSGNYVVPEVFPRIEWVSSNIFQFEFKGQTWQYDVTSHGLLRTITAIPIAINKEVSPDGSKSCFVHKRNLYWSYIEMDSVRITTVEKEKITAGMAVHRYEFGILKGTFWSPKSDRLAFYVNDESPVSEYPLVNYYGSPAVETPLVYPMSGQASENVSVFVYDFSNFKAVKLETGPVSEDYLTNITWSPDGKHIYVAHLNRGQDHMRLVRYDAKTGQVDRVLFEEKHEKYVEPEHGPFFLDGTKGEFLWFSERDGYQHLYRYSAKGELLGQVTKGNHVIQKIEHYDASTGELFVSGTDTAVEKVLYKVDISGGEMQKITKDKGTHRVQVNKKTGHFIDRYSSVSVPRTIRICDRNGAVVKTLLEAKDPLRANLHGTTELMTIQGDDGLDLHARIIKPSDFDPTKKYPVLVYVYGGPHAQLVTDSWLGGAPLWMHVAAERGFIIFTVDGRGSANRGADFEQAVFRQLGTLEMKDQLAGVKYLKSLPYVDSERLAVHGWSFGGFMTSTLMLKSPDTFKVGVAGGPVTDWTLYEVMYTERYMDTPEENPAGYSASRLYEMTPNLKGDLLLIHGTSDDVVVMQHSMVLLNGFINNGKQVDFFPYPGHAHNVRGQDRVHLMTKVLGYIEDKLGMTSE